MGRVYSVKLREKSYSNQYILNGVGGGDLRMFSVEEVLDPPLPNIVEYKTQPQL